MTEHTPAVGALTGERGVKLLLTAAVIARLFLLVCSLLPLSALVHHAPCILPVIILVLPASFVPLEAIGALGGRVSFWLNKYELR